MKLFEMPKKKFHLSQVCEFLYLFLGIFLWEGMVDRVEVTESILWGFYGDRGSVHTHSHWLWTIGAEGNSIVVPDVH